MEHQNNSTGIRVEEGLTPMDHSVDWQGRPCKASHGGTKSAIFVLGIQAFEITAIAAVGNNLITYVFNDMHFSLSKSANVVTNFVGTIFLLSLLGGFLSDSYFGSFWTIIIFGFVELSGFILLSVQAQLPQLRPPACNMRTQGSLCQEAKGFQALIFFVALYLVALGSGCLKPNMLSHGGDQFSRDDPRQSRKLSSYFNAAYLSFSIGELIALTVLVWVQTHSGMGLGFGISAAAMAMGLGGITCGTTFYRNKPPQGSIFTPIAQVLVAAIAKRKTARPCKPELLHGNHPDASNLNSFMAVGKLLHTERFRFLDKACIITEDGMTRKENPWRLSTVTQVEQVKILISVIPIFACTIIFNTILAQLQTFSVQQGSTMNTQLSKNFKVPPASLQSIPYIMLIFVVPLYDTVCVPFARKISGKESGISPLQRIGVGLFTATFSMVAAALVEYKRRKHAQFSNQSISIFWITPQFLIFGLAEMFTAVGLIEFFYKQSLAGMQSFLTAVTYCSYSFGFFLSSFLVSLINKITSGKSHTGWLSDNDLNNDRLDLFYWLLAILSLLNFCQYIFWSRWFTYNPALDPTQLHDLYREDMNFNFSRHSAEEIVL